MIIETKYDLRQPVWVMLRQPNDNIMEATKPDCREIHGITRKLTAVGLKTIYHLEKYRGAFECDYEEDDIFKTKEDLLAAEVNRQKS